MQLRRLERHPKRFGDAGLLTPSEIHTIEAIGDEGGVRMSELAGRLGVTKGAVTQIVSRLEEKELLTRSPHPHDSRATVLTLSEKGKEAFRAHEDVHDRFYERLRARLSDSEIDIFEKGLRTLIESLED
ncbi:MarR family winged helix-turn-helix transcriptional regulator [Paenibacillus flagellatus]|uniref:MarR family transcriptional regulator n=1 Tax=Paenibacillus flagellatus TaxID=2211139 RepID=A0A2V5K3M9_9BACL|nr:MarR family transcriptional regulator [Paenibacillus flagellatus]PYI53811.1 MarR family transcriptional regulator [Paenibacillus flagellatus]